MRARPVGLIAGLAALVGIAWADPQDNTALERFAAGDFLAAAGLARTEASADSLALAARAMNASMMFDGTIDAGALDTAEHDAQAAIERDRGHVEGRLQLAIALALRARQASLAEAISAQYAERTRALAIGVLRDAPDNFYAHGFMSVWHIEARRRAGPIAAALMGASLTAARRHYETALSISDDDIGLCWQYGRALVSIDPVARRAEAIGALARAGDHPASDILGQRMQERARVLLTLLRENPQAAQRYALATL